MNIEWKALAEQIIDATSSVLDGDIPYWARSDILGQTGADREARRVRWRALIRVRARRA